MNSPKPGCTLEEDDVCPTPGFSCSICKYHKDYHKGKRRLRVGKPNENGEIWLRKKPLKSLNKKFLI